MVTESADGDPDGINRVRTAIRHVLRSFLGLASKPEPPPGPLGVVFVHGLGSQPRGETLLNWSGAIVHAVSVWAASCPDADQLVPGDRVVNSEIAFDGDDVPLVHINVPGATIRGVRHEPQTWYMTEAWWAQRVTPPSLGAMIDWCGPQRVVANVVERLIRHLNENKPGGNGRAVVAALGRIGFGLFLSTAVTILLLLYAALRAIAALVPIKTLRDGLAQVQLDALLTKWWGSGYLLLEDPVQSANIRGRLDRSIRALREVGCTRIAVIAHSGGTLVSYMALADPMDQSIRADTLITHGEAIAMGRRISDPPRLAPGASPRIGDGNIPGRWADFWASHDPAPCGRLSPEFDDAGGSVVHDNRPVWNRRSVINDHGTYWDNDEEFVCPVIAALDVAGTRRSPAESRFAFADPPIAAGGVPRESWVQRRRQRVAMLTLWVRTLFVIPIVATVGAFAIGRPDTVRALGNAGYSAAGWIEGVKDAAVSVSNFRLEWSFGDALLLAVGLVAIALVVLAALVHAAMPIEQSGVWPRMSLPWLAYAGLDLAPAVFVLGITTFAILRFFDWFGGHEFDRGLVWLVAGMVLVAALVGLLMALPEVGLIGWIQRRAQNHPAFIASALLFAILFVVASIAYALVVEEGIRTWVVGTLVAFVAFQALGAIGRWRWNVWDRREREAFWDQAFRPTVKQPSRLWPTVQIVLLGTSAVLGGATIFLDWPLGGWVTVLVVAALVFVSVLRDAALRATPIAEGRGVGGSGGVAPAPSPSGR